MRLGTKILVLTIISVLISTLMTFSATMGTVRPQPDFAFPKKASALSLKELRVALRENNSPKIVGSLINYALAEGMVDSDSVPQVISLIEETRDKVKDSCAASLLALVEAQIYNDIYQSDRWKFDERNLPITPLPENYLEWSGEQFQARIIGLIDDALSNKDALKSVALKEYSALLETDSYTYIYYPTLLDFVISDAVGMCKNMTRSYSLYTTDLTLKPDAPLAAKTIDTLYNMIIAESPVNSAPNVKWRLDYLLWIDDHTDFSASSPRTIRHLMSLYEECEGTEYSGDILQAIADRSPSSEEISLQKQICHMLRTFLNRYPDYYGNNCITNSLNTLLQPKVRVSAPKMVAPGSEAEITVFVENARDFSVEIYSLPTANILTDDWITLNRYPHNIVSRYKRSVDQSAPFDTTLTITANSFPKEGYYVIVPNLPDSPRGRGNSYPVVYCTRSAMGFLGLKNTVVVSLDPQTGRPMVGTDVKYKSNRDRNSVFRNIGKTDSDGMFELKSIQTGQIAVQNGVDHYTPTFYYYPSNYNEGKGRGYGGEIFTALQIYRPGDKVEVAAVAFSDDNKGEKKGCHPLADERVDLIVRDANYQEVDTLEMTTDAYGRVFGEFVIPEGRLTGNYTLSLTYTGDREDRILARKPLMVSDYKLPTFKVEISQVLLSTPSNGDVTLTGKIETYSGFAMGDASLEMDLKVNNSYWWWRSGPSVEVLKTSVPVKGDGTFKIVVDKVTFEKALYPKGRYTAQFTATSSTGESRTASKSFSMGEAYTIKADIPASLDVTKPVRLDVSVLDAENKPVDTTLEYLLCLEGSDTIRGILNTRNPVVDLSNLTPATYSLTFVPQGKIAGACESESAGEVALYRPDVNKSPSERPLWTPMSEYAALPGSKINILYGTPGEESHVLVVTQADDKEPQYQWIHESAGLHDYQFEMPQAMKVKVTMLSTYGYRNSQLGFVISNPLATRKLKIERESFRDHLIPGSEEKWVIRISDNDGKPETAAVIVDMYNRALDALVSGGNWNLSTTSYPTPWLRWSAPEVVGNNGSSTSANIKYLRCKSVMTPEFNLYGYGFYQSMAPTYHIRGLSRGTAKLDAVYEEAEETVAVGAVAELDGVVEHKQAVMMSTAQFASNGVTEDSDSPLEEEVIADTSAESSDSKPSEPEFQFRDAETSLAFFRPMLTTDAEGRLAIEFVVPNANAAWSLNALAWTSEMVTGNMQADVTSSKPVMVQPNLPRFLRTGDEAVIRAMVMNNTDSIRTVTTLIEIFDPADGKLLYTPVRVESVLEPHGSEVAQTSVTVPDGTAMLGYRVKSISGDFADGEQTAIPVLPSSQAVVETQPFYIAPDAHRFELQLPKIDKGARVTLQYCENPAWYVVTALPGLSSDKPRTAVEAAVNIFSTAVAEGLLRTNPAISDAIKEWSESNRSDSTLVSMLERNQDLKTVLLQATPWMMDAHSDTERMERLVLLFDKERCKKAIDESIRLLSDLQQYDGGWGWTPQFLRSSEWLTYLVLDKMGGLIRLNFLPDNPKLKDMIEKGVKYCDDEVVKSYRKYPDSDYSSYTIMRDLFPSIPQNSEAKHVSEVTVQRMLKGWKKYSVSEKCFAAMTFYRHGYTNVGRVVLASLREFAVYEPSKGMWWPSEYGDGLESLNIAARILDVMALLDPESKDIDYVRQWLIFEKEVRNWGDGSTATAIIGSLLTVSDRWIEPAMASEIRVGSQLVEVDVTDKNLGYFRTDISALHPTQSKLTILKRGDTPAWGALYEQYTASMDGIKAVSCDAVKIEKRMTLVDGASSSELHTGDRVRIQLVITTSRNMDYVTINDERAACLEPVDQIPGYVYSEGVGFYRENRDSSTRLFIDNLPKGTYILTYDMFVNNAGRYSSGIATIQSQYAPAQTAHSASYPVIVD